MCACFSSFIFIVMEVKKANRETNCRVSKRQQIDNVGLLMGEIKSRINCSIGPDGDMRQQLARAVRPIMLSASRLLDKRADLKRLRAPVLDAGYTSAATTTAFPKCLQGSVVVRCYFTRGI